MTKSVKLPDELAKKVGQFTNKDETWADGIARLLAHTDTDAVMEDRNNRETVYSEGQVKAGNPETQPENEDHPFNQLGDGTTVRHKYRRGDYAGDVVEGTIEGTKIVVEGDSELRSPSGAAKFADRQHRGDDAREGGWNGWEWWEFQNDDGEWAELLRLTELGE
ncbi:hypothetical protein PM025_16605 [Halorubrum ezzemoulense]|uniref:hypothetical protein n=1 Tax=Halorubrum ezzemoulense TaxID=337243 RepID=UPI00232BE3CB|nr:hypothetical protein [Halorubrum ezzemoulense]MDB2265721.1 hypothetical protein [Halorubrum ezzemoulense]